MGSYATLVGPWETLSRSFAMLRVISPPIAATALFPAQPPPTGPASVWLLRTLVDFQNGLAGAAQTDFRRFVAWCTFNPGAGELFGNRVNALRDELAPLIPRP
jgi:hypothetical protein